MAGVLSQIPFLAGYDASRLAAESGQARELQQVGALSQLHAQMQERAQAQQLRESLSASGGDLEKAMQAAIAAGNLNGAAKLGQLIEARKKVQPQGQPIGPGGILMPDGRIISPAEPQSKRPAVGTIRTRYDGENAVQEELQADGSYKEIGRGPRFAKSVGPTIVNPAPVTPVTVMRDGRPVIVDARTGREIGDAAPKTTTEKALPGSLANKYLENIQNLRKAENALTLLEGNQLGDATGDKSATGKKGLLTNLGVLGDTALNAMDPEGVDTRAAIGDLGSMVIHDRSGAAVTAAEFPRLRPFIPLATDSPEVARKKTRRFIQEYKAEVEAQKEFFTSSGYKVPEIGSSPAKPDKPQYTEGQTATGPNGQKLVFKGGKWQPM
jgi:hypothetical protein